MFADAAQTVSAAIGAIGKAVDYVKNNVAGHAHDGAMTDVTRLTRAEPLTIISQDCGTLEVLPELLNTLTNVYRDWETDRKSTRLNSSHSAKSRMPSSA